MIPPLPFSVFCRYTRYVYPHSILTKNGNQRHSAQETQSTVTKIYLYMPMTRLIVYHQPAPSHYGDTRAPKRIQSSSSLLHICCERCASLLKWLFESDAQGKHSMHSEKSHSYHLSTKVCLCVA